MKAEPNRKQTSVNAAASTTVGLDCLPAVKNFSSSERLLRITAFILRFIHNTRARAQKSEQQFGKLTSKEIEKSDLMWMKELQKSLAQQQLKELKRTLDPFRDEEDIVRCRGRLMSTDLPHVTKFPVLVPPSHLTTLIIRDCHERVMHNGVKEILSEFRTRFWLARGRQIVKKETA